MRLQEFIEESRAKLVHGADQIAVGIAETAFNGFEKSMQTNFLKIHDMAKGT
jgi:hypothetical protein